MYPSPTGLPPCPEDEDCDPCKSTSPEDMNQDINANKNCCSKCTGDVGCNMFFTDRAAGFPGRCILDEMTYQQVWDILIRNPKAKEDLMRITTDPILLSLARESKLVQTCQEDDEKAAKIINANTLPFYTFFRGNLNGI